MGDDREREELIAGFRDGVPGCIVEDFRRVDRCCWRALAGGHSPEDGDHPCVHENCLCPCHQVEPPGQLRTNLVGCSLQRDLFSDGIAKPWDTSHDTCRSAVTVSAGSSCFSMFLSATLAMGRRIPGSSLGTNAFRRKCSTLWCFGKNSLESTPKSRCGRRQRGRVRDGPQHLN